MPMEQAQAPYSPVLQYEEKKAVVCGIEERFELHQEPQVTTLELTPLEPDAPTKQCAPVRMEGVEPLKLELLKPLSKIPFEEGTSSNVKHSMEPEPVFVTAGDAMENPSLDNNETSTTVGSLDQLLKGLDLEPETIEYIKNSAADRADTEKTELAIREPEFPVDQEPMLLDESQLKEEVVVEYLEAKEMPPVFEKVSHEAEACAAPLSPNNLSRNEITFKKYQADFEEVECVEQKASCEPQELEFFYERDQCQQEVEVIRAIVESPAPVLSPIVAAAEVEPQPLRNVILVQKEETPHLREFDLLDESPLEMIEAAEEMAIMKEGVASEMGQGGFCDQVLLEPLPVLSSQESGLQQPVIGKRIAEKLKSPKIEYHDDKIVSQHAEEFASAPIKVIQQEIIDSFDPFANPENSEKEIAKPVDETGSTAAEIVFKDTTDGKLPQSSTAPSISGPVMNESQSFYIPVNDDRSADLSRPGSASSMKGTAVPGIRPSSPKKDPVPNKPSSSKPSLKPLDLSAIPVEDVMSEIEVRMSRLHQTENFTNCKEDLVYLAAVTKYGNHRSPERLKLIGRLAELGVVDILRKIYEKYATRKTTRQLKDITIVLWNGTDSSEAMCQAVVDSKVYEDLFGYMNHEYFRAEDIANNVSKKYLLKGMMGILNNTARWIDTSRSLFREVGGMETLQKYLKVEDTMVCCKTEIILSYLMTEKEYEATKADDSSIKFILKLLVDALKYPDHQSKTYGFSVDEVVEALNRMAVSEINSEKILAHGGLEHLISLLGEGASREEQYLAARGIWLLAFKGRDQIKENAACLSAVKELAERTEDNGVKKQAQGALWILEGKDQETEHASDTVPDDEDDDSPHIFISYQWSSQETILRIRDRLKENGFKVWMDVESMSGSILEAMARAVEKAAVVIVCMSEKYKESPNCRTEAEYTFRLRKEIVPLRMQYKYEADGWLGALIGNKLFFDFSSENRFEKSVAGLVKELGARGRSKNFNRGMSVAGEVILPRTASVTGAAPPAQTGAATWDVARVAEWLTGVRVKGDTEWFRDVDGPMLLELRDLHRDAPEFFYSVLQREVNLRLKDILKFTHALKQLK